MVEPFVVVALSPYYSKLTGLTSSGQDKVGYNKLNLLTKSSARLTECATFFLFSHRSVLGASSRVPCHGGLRDDTKEGLCSRLVL